MPDDASATAAPAARTFGGMSPQEAARKRWEKQREREAQGLDGARHVNATARDRTPLDALRDLMSRDPDAYAEGLAKLVRTGDPRSITIMRELFTSSGSVAIPRAEATVRALTREERTALLLELEARGATLPTLPDEATSGGVDDPEPVDA